MEKLQREYITKMIRVLDGIGAKYHIVVDDEVFGQPVVKKQTKGPVVNRGVTEYIWSFVKDLNVGEVTTIPVGEYQLSSLQSNVSAVFNNREFGKCMTRAGHDFVEVMRTE